MMRTERDYYEILGVARDATAEEIRRAYRRLAREHHPDVNRGDATAETRFKEIAAAYEVLSDPGKRARYDRFGHAGAHRGLDDFDFGGFGGFGDLFESFFGGMGRAPRTAAAERGADLEHELEVTLEQAAVGIERPIRISHMRACSVCDGSGGKSGSRPMTCPACRGTGEIRHATNTVFGMRFATVATCERCRGRREVQSDPCPNCSGRGRERRADELTISIPAGVESGMRLRVAGEGDARAHGAHAGDLYVNVTVSRHPFFERRGTELICEVPLPFTTAALGGSLTVPSLAGESELHIPAGTQSGSVFRLKGKGMPDPHARHPGDQHVVVRVVVPTRLTAEQRRLLEKFVQAGGGKVGERDRELFDRRKDASAG